MFVLFPARVSLFLRSFTGVCACKSACSLDGQPLCALQRVWLRASFCTLCVSVCSRYSKRTNRKCLPCKCSFRRCGNCVGLCAHRELRRCSFECGALFRCVFRAHDCVFRCPFPWEVADLPGTVITGETAAYSCSAVCSVREPHISYIAYVRENYDTS